MLTAFERFYKLEREYREISKQVSSSVNATDIVQLRKHRNEIVAEAREIVRTLNVPEP
jgi:hypothetical protein